MANPKIKNLKLKIKNFLRLGLLMGIKEGYLFTRNTYGLFEHPLLTTKKIVAKRDLSQGILIFGLPAYLWLGWILVLLVSRVFIFQKLQFGFWAKASFLASSLITFSIFLFFVYWILEVIKKGRREQ